MQPAGLSPDGLEELPHVGVEQLPEVALRDPEVPDRLLRVVAVERAREADAVDPAGRRAGDDVHADLDPVRVASVGGGLLERVEQVCVHPGRPGRPGAREAHGRAGHELLDLARDAAHVDRERHAAVADDGQSRLECCGFVPFHRTLLTDLSDGRGVRHGSR